MRSALRGAYSRFVRCPVTAAALVLGGGGMNVLLKLPSVSGWRRLCVLLWFINSVLVRWEFWLDCDTQTSLIRDYSSVWL